MEKVYRVSHGVITEYELIKETDKTFEVRFLSGIGITTRIQKSRDAYKPGTPRASHNEVSTKNIDEAIKIKDIHLDALIAYHESEIEKYKSMR